MTSPSRFATDDPEVIAFRRGRKPLAMLFGLLLFGFGVFLIVAVATGSGGERGKALGAALVCCGLGAVLMVGEGWRIDRRAGTVATWLSVLRVPFRRVRRLDAFTGVVVRARAPNLVVCLHGERDLELWVSSSPALAREAAAQIAGFLGLETGYTPEASAAAGGPAPQEELPELPAGSRLSFTAEDRTLAIVQAPRGYGPAQIALAAAIALPFLAAVVGLFVLMSDVRGVFVCTAVTALVPLGIGALLLLRFHAEVGRPVRMVFSPELLRIESPAVLGRRITEVPVGWVTDVGFLSIHSDWSQSGAPISREPGAGGHVIVRRKDGEDLHLGRGLSVEEQRWLCAVIERMATIRARDDGPRASAPGGGAA